MSYIRSRGQELTGYQERAPWSPEIDLQCDFVMVYGVDGSMPDRVREYRAKGYVVHLMSGIAWGQYQDYLDGQWDGRSHWDESQMDREGKPILHGVDVPYLVPTIAFADYLTQKLKPAIDAGVEAIHLEEPEFWDHGGYSPAFQREYQLYYREPWTPPHSSLDARYKAARLKAWLYARALGRISSALKEYALTEHGRLLRFYVPTHSLLNYTQWAILSPEAALLEIPTVDGYIAQVWTGTSRVCNVYQGVAAQRTFETAYLEYGVMQELARGTGRKMWFLHDPIEDWPEYTWEDYRRNYLKTVVASLLHPLVHTYEICPWPSRVFNGIFPRKAGLAGGTIPTEQMEGAKPIPEDYAALLSGMAQLLGDLDQPDWSPEGNPCQAGILISDSALYQRSYPDGVLPEEARPWEGGLAEKLRDLAAGLHDGIDTRRESRALTDAIGRNGDFLREWAVTPSLPHFYGMALPLLKHGLPVRPVQLDNLRRFPGYLDGCGFLILSYEFIKPEAPDINGALAAWVREGGSLLYIGDGSDPYHAVQGWWSPSPTPLEHLLRLLELPEDAGDGTYPVGRGRLTLWRMNPARLCANADLADRYRAMVRELLPEWKPCNYLAVRRGPYRIAAVMEESVHEDPLILRGQFVDLLDGRLGVCTEKIISPGENAILFDLDAIQEEPVRIVGTSARVYELECGENAFHLELKAADRIRISLRVRLPKPVRTLSAQDESGTPFPLEWEWDPLSRTLLLSCHSSNRLIRVEGAY